MKKRTNELALENLHLKPKEIWDKLSEELNAIQPTWKGLTDFQVTVRVHNIPILYILMTNKSQKMYRNTLEWVFKLSRRRINPHTVTCDFELALINAIQGIFPFAKINGCLFHWKQAIKRKLGSLKLKNEKEIIEYTIIINSIDILTLIPIYEIREKGIPFIKDNLKVIRKIY